MTLLYQQMQQSQTCLGDTAVMEIAESKTDCLISLTSDFNFKKKEDIKQAILDNLLYRRTFLLQVCHTAF